MIKRAIGVLLLLAGAAYAGDPEQRWRTIDTEHFHIHYYVLPEGRGLENVAQRLAVIAERAHATLVPYLGEGLKRRTHVVVVDNTDDYNGFAGVYPYPAVTVIATSPDDRAELNDYDDWLTGLFVHEYSHILHVGTIGGPCAWVINALLGWGIGIIWAPNQLQPRFILEGLAVHEESARTTGGRLRGSIWNMYLRMATLENRLQRIDQFTHSPIQFPQANSQYLYGSALLHYVAERYGEQALLELSRDYGRTCIPGGINRSIRHVTGKTWMQLYADFRDEMRRKYGAQRDAVRARGETRTTRLLDPRPALARPHWLPDGKILFFDDDGYRRQRIARIDPAQAARDPRRARLTTELETDASGGLSGTPDGRTLFFHANDVWRTNYIYNDVHALDRASGKKHRITEGKRASNPAVSADGKRVAFELNQTGARGLGLVEVSRCRDESCPVEVLIPPGDFEQVYTPAFSPDGARIAFSWWKSGGYRDLFVYDLKSNQIERLTEDRAMDLDPRFSPDGKYLYFVSDRTGIFNLYAYELETRKTFQATNVLGGVFDPAISPDGKRVAFVGFRADGYVLEIAALDRSTWWEADPQLMTRAPAQPPPVVSAPRPSRRYNPFPTVLPFVFRPFYAPDGYGELLGITLSGGDVASRHFWSMLLAFGTGRADDINFSFNYSYAGLWPSLSMGVGHALTRKGGLIIDGRDVGYDEDSWTFGTGIGLPLYRRIVDSVDLSFSYNLSYLRNVSGVPEPDPSHTVPQIPETGRISGFGLGLSYSNLRRFLYSVSPETGRIIALSLGVGARVLGSTRDLFAVSWRWSEHLPIRWPVRWLRNHVVYLNYSGGVSGGAGRPLFFLGGYPPQDLLRSLYDFSRPGSAALRGYPYASLVGDQFHVFNFEYRFPITWIERGFETLPFYFRRLHGRVFVDYGGAFFGSVGLDKLKLGVGAEIMLEVFYAWQFPAAFQLGYAHGFSEGGGDQVYFFINNPF